MKNVKEIHEAIMKIDKQLKLYEQAKRKAKDVIEQCRIHITNANRGIAYHTQLRKRMIRDLHEDRHI